MESTSIPVEKFDGTNWTPFYISVQDAMNQVDAKLWHIASTACSGSGGISSSTAAGTSGTSGTTPSKSAAAAMDLALGSKALIIIRSNCHKDVKVHIYSAASASDAMVTLKAVSILRDDLLEASVVKTDHDTTWALIKGLFAAYETLRTMLRLNSRSMTLVKVVAALEAHEQTLEATADDPSFHAVVRGGHGSGRGGHGGRGGGRGFGGSSTQQPRVFQGNCNKCGQWGHMQKDCPKNNEKAVFSVGSGFGLGEKIWLVNSGAPNHITPP
ncbi:hypothetical protein AXG93_150s1050 [Marchantia polymorpha subsp. ruderalis]|uniref:CCHC-type domain-containing protein n=1 Tax=Marchantia polymorpha subsp. ruderalis TaxID=1480154 RepID=A0A176WG50_MARPO|nr:hypothetical protein AXG93_150s1050 [Marchantia polymorpha subsp. ruderalis]